MSELQKQVSELTKRISGQTDAHLFESIVSLFNQGVLKHYVRTPRANYDSANFKMTIDAASGVMFEGREKMVEMEKEIQQVQSALEKSKQREDKLQECGKFLINCLKNYYPFKEHLTGLQAGLSPEFYQTLSYDGDNKLLSEFKKCLAEIKGME